jgi:hypothetical protein
MNKALIADLTLLALWAVGFVAWVLHGAAS